jgi:catechol-2,3-dioxygenase
MIKALRHAGLVVNDADRALSFYKDLLGLSIFKDAMETGPFIEHILGMPGVKVRTIKMHCGQEGLLELLHFSQPASSAERKKLMEHGFTHIALTVENLEALHDRLTKAGIDVVAPPKTSPDGKAKVMFCCDFEGNYLELVEEIR